MNGEEKSNKRTRLKLAYKKQLKYTHLAFGFILIGVVNLVVTYMFFPRLLMKGLGVSTLLIIVGIAFCIGINKALKNISAEIAEIE